MDFKDAAREPEAIAALWHSRPGPLIGIATGESSRIDVLDIDVKHPESCAWWYQHHHRLPPTRTFRTRSGGLHLYFSMPQASRTPTPAPFLGSISVATEDMSSPGSLLDTNAWIMSRQRHFPIGCGWPCGHLHSPSHHAQYITTPSMRDALSKAC
jgi:Bifunctional DNA primase/polymerase, N-terminal